MPKRSRPPKAEIIEYKQLKAAAGGSGSSGGGGGFTGYRAGQNVACRVNYAERDGYAVTIQKDNLPGFLKTANPLNAGDEIIGVFVCVDKGRILLSQPFSTKPADGKFHQNAENWVKYLNDDTLTRAYEQLDSNQRNQSHGSRSKQQHSDGVQE